MIRLLICVSFLFSFLAYSSFALAGVDLKLPGYEVDRISDHNISYKKNDKFQTVILLNQFSHEKSIVWTKEAFQKEVKNIENKRQQLLSYGGISQYKINQSDFKTHNDLQLLTYRGNYKGVSGKIVSFVEMSLYHGKEQLQVILTQENVHKIPNKIIQELFSCIKESRACDI